MYSDIYIYVAVCSIMLVRCMICVASSQVVYAITTKVATVLLALFPGSPCTRAWERGYCVITATRVTLLWLKQLICFCGKYILAHKPELLLQVYVFL